jgi:hypothetical protein
MPLPPARFPGVIASATDLLVQGNVVPSQAGNFPTVLGSLAASATNFMLASGYGQQLPTDNFEVSIDDEIIFVGLRTGDQLSNCVRGAEGTTASTHANGAAVLANLTAKAHNQNAAEIVAVETFLGGALAKNSFLASPSASGGVPGFRLIAPADLPAPLNGGSEAKNLFYASPIAAAGAPAFRALDSSDLPNPVITGDVQVGGEIYTAQWSFPITQANQVNSITLPGGTSFWGIHLLAALVELAGAGGTWSANAVTWLASTWQGYIGTVELPSLTQQSSAAVDNDITARVTAAGAVNAVVHFTTTGWTSGDAGNLVVRALRLLEG